MIRNPWAALRRRGPAAVAACVFALGLAGCSNQPKQQQAAEVDKSADAAFQAGANRPPTDKTLLATARIYAAQGKDAECESLLKRCIHDYPHFSPAYCDLAELQLRQRRTDDAIASLTVANKLSPNDPVVLNNLGMCWLLQKDYGKALDFFSQAAAVAPNDARSRANMAVALGMQGRYDEALALYLQIVSPSEAYENVAILAEARNDVKEATKDRAQAHALSKGQGRP